MIITWELGKLFGDFVLENDNAMEEMGKDITKRMTNRNIFKLRENLIMGMDSSWKDKEMLCCIKCITH